MSLMIHDISMSYGDTQVLKNISADINNGEFISILGHSGCGKTTLLKILAGFIRPTSGEVEMNGVLYSNHHHVLTPDKRNMGMVFQSFALWPHMTVRDHVEFPLECQKTYSTKEEANKRVTEVLEITGLSSLADRYPDELSGGQKQRVSLARAIAPGPSLLLMDEPLSALDADLRISMRKEIKKIHQATGATVVFVTHDQGEALSMSDRILVLKDGAIEQMGTPEEVYLKPATPFIASFIGRCNFFHGEWTGNTFHTAQGKFVFNGQSVANVFQQENICPIRPEQIQMSRTGQGIPGIVRERQYNGREIHYAVSSGQDMYTVYTGSNEQFRLGEEVYLQCR